MTEQPTTQQGELVKFGIVVLIAVVVVLVVALSRPFIFDRVVPAVLGEGQTAVPASDEPVDDGAYPALEDAAADEESTGQGGEPETAVTPESEDAATDESEDSQEGENGEESEAGAESSESETPPITHVVQPGETLTAIARIYNVTVDQLAAANNISNPNVVPVGTTLVIPSDK